jgi:hypothetical protein
MSNIICTALAAALAISVPAAADETRNSSPTPRQMAHCVLARVKMDKNQNYKTAFKACREQFESVPGEPRERAVNVMNNVDAAESARQ